MFVGRLVGFGEWLGIEMAVIRGEAAPGGQLKLPAVHRARQYAVFDPGEARQVSFEVRAAPLDAIAFRLPELIYLRLLRIVALGVLDALWREALEEVVDIIVVCAPALRLEAARQEDIIHPVFEMVNDAVFDQRAVEVEAIIPLLVCPRAHLSLVEVEDDVFGFVAIATLQEDQAVDASSDQIGLLHNRLEPLGERRQNLDLPARP